jgi:hypothetical protein
VPRPRCRVADKHSRYAARHAEIAPSEAALPSLRPPQWLSHRLLRRPAHHSRRHPGRQIAMDGHRLQRPPRVPSLEAFGRRPSVPVDTSRLGRHPKPFTDPEAAWLPRQGLLTAQLRPVAARQVSGGSAPKAVIRLDRLWRIGNGGAGMIGSSEAIDLGV